MFIKQQGSWIPTAYLIILKNFRCDDWSSDYFVFFPLEKYASNIEMTWYDLCNLLQSHTEGGVNEGKDRIGLALG